MEPLTFGVEEEFFLVDRFGRCVTAAPEVLRTVAPAEVEFSAEVSEFQVESVSPICRTAGELIGKLESGRRALAVAADRHGHRLVACGAPIHELDRPFPVTETSRYLRIAEEMGAMLESLLTSGCHVHIGMPDLEHAVAVSNQLRAFLPGLLALSANSPFHRGVDSGHASWRSTMWWQVPSAGPPPVFESVSHYQDGVREVLRSGAALDRGMIYWLMRPSSHLPTLEIRIGDVLPTAEEALLFALIIRGLAATALIRVDAGLPPPAVAEPTLRLALWRAARDGADGMVIDPMTGELLPGRVLIDRMIAWARPGLAAMGDEAVVTALLAASRRAESPVARQRAAFARRNSIQDVVELLARRTRGVPSPAP
ncbi:carboxylate-amine ligase [Actinoalloteichus hymeniacidonis]|uniref:Putative glutamate--cysteine ligase 2 n=1 Tax=Actinoalloteichus hymeniacidonis TaxID=340345 RepID=A0AAC9HQ63_9PSEU|nr:glutamate--cysteine ligase [Actinoalloteichus hymeniacidonis]AOS63454.1 carboxylate-amine ligase, YbdK family [Actinoalloteichus hymeniacidonis]MBB5908504.1 carboxylate-amine ligase [Actinoalloteichus hymeniacidonis]